MTEPGKNIIGRFAWIYFFILFIVVFIIFNILKIQIVEGDNWRSLYPKNPWKNISVAPNRGNIYSSDGRLMASSLPSYYTYLDLRVEALHQKDGKLFFENVDTLAECLANYFKDKPKSVYKQELINGHRNRAHSFQFHKQKLGYSQLKEIRTFPLFNLGQNKSGLIVKESHQRVKPFGSLASRTIGDIYGDDSRGKNGLEKGLDSLLVGVAGVSSREKVANTFRNIIQIEPIDGMDIVSTININFQDIAEKALVDKLREIDAQTGYAIVMEAKTGEVKAIVNMERNRDGSYSENKNGAVSDMAEPGSTFKVASLMAVLDDGKAKLTDSIATGNGIYIFAKARMRDHNAHRGGYGTISLENAINASSNVGISRTVYNAYSNQPEKFVDKLYKMGLNEKFELFIPGTAAPRIRHPKVDKSTWSATSLPWMSIGYEVQIPPIYTVAFFNAIANNGKFLEPTLVKSINKNGQIIKEIKPRVIREQICSSSTLEDVRKTLLGVVEHPKYGTGKAAHSPNVRIAGKTGTAQISKGSAGYKGAGVSHQVSFCGFFPYEDPKYTCLVVIREPRIGAPSGGLMAGSVVKTIAERITAIDTTSTIYNLKLDSIYITHNQPKVKSGNLTEANKVMKLLGQSINNDWNDTWASLKTSDNQTTITNEIDFINDNTVPNLSGLGAKDAIFVCENLGLKPRINGIGKVKSQSLHAGIKLTKGQSITLNLEP